MWNLIYITTAILCFSYTRADNLEITTNNGKIRGITLKAVSGKEVDAWYGIPFAKKPLGNLRFKAPKAVNSWDDVLETTTLPNVCVQTVDTFFGDFPGATMWIPNRPVSEDCLYLNLVVPKPRPQNATVMVWIYGGGFYTGSSTLDIYDYKTLASEENVIVVAMQYRVASLGFLYFGNSEVPGNVGFLDQVMALQWVQDNIAAFGGDPNKVTIFGESAGSGSVSYHLLSPLSQNLFNRAIMQSGTVTAPWALVPQKRSINRGLQLAKAVGCPHHIKDVTEVIECLRKVNATELVYAESQIPLYGILDFPFLPTKDGVFIVEDPKVQLAKKDFKSASILLGANGEEGNYFLFYHLPDIFKLEENVTVTYEEFVNIVRSLRNDKTTLENEAIIHEYTNWDNPNDVYKNREALEKIVGDQYFTCSVNNFADAFAEARNDVYVYHYLHKSDRHYWPNWSGALHADEVAFVFGEPMKLERGYSPDEIDLSKAIMKLWSNFAKSGDPNSPSVVHDCKWPTYKVNKRNYVDINLNKCKTRTGVLRAKQCAFWTHLIPKLKHYEEKHKTGE